MSGTATRQNLMQSRQGGGEWLRIGRKNMGRRIQSCVPGGRVGQVGRVGGEGWCGVAVKVV